MGVPRKDKKPEEKKEQEQQTSGVPRKDKKK